MTQAALAVSDRQLNKLAHILEMTSSDVDAEALVAARKASQMLKKHGYTYETFINALKTTTDKSTNKKIKMLEKQLVKQQIEIECLKKINSGAAQSGKKMPFIGPLQGLRLFLMKNFALRKHEKELLEKIEDVQPNSKEAYLVLICARRYGVCTEGAQF